MITQLMESGSRPRRSIRGAALSFVAHYGLILVALYASAQAEVLDTGPTVETIDFVEPIKIEPAREKTAHRRPAGANSRGVDRAARDSNEASR